MRIKMKYLTEHKKRFNLETDTWADKQNKANRQTKQSTGVFLTIRTWLPYLLHFKDFLTSSTWLQSRASSLSESASEILTRLALIGKQNNFPHRGGRFTLGFFFGGGDWALCCSQCCEILRYVWAGGSTRLWEGKPTEETLTPLRMFCFLPLYTSFPVNR